LLRRLVNSGTLEEDDARDAYYLLQTDDLHNPRRPGMVDIRQAL